MVFEGGNSCTGRALYGHVEQRSPMVLGQNADFLWEGLLSPTATSSARPFRQRASFATTPNRYNVWQRSARNEFTPMLGKTISHYRILEKRAAGAWVWCTRPRTPSSADSLP